MKYLIVIMLCVMVPSAARADCFWRCVNKGYTALSCQNACGQDDDFPILEPYGHVNPPPRAILGPRQDGGSFGRAMEMLARPPSQGCTLQYNPSLGGFVCQ